MIPLEETVKDGGDQINFVRQQYTETKYSRVYDGKTSFFGDND